MYSVNIRYYSQEGLLVWKSRESYRELPALLDTLSYKLIRELLYLHAVPFPDEKKPTHRDVYGISRVCTVPLNKCNIQVRKDGKLIPWKKYFIL